MTNFNTTNAPIALLLDVGVNAQNKKNRLLAEKDMLENAISNSGAIKTNQQASGEEYKNHKESRRLRYVMLSYVISTRAFYAATKKLLPQISEREMQEALESAQDEMLDKYNIEGGGSLSAKLKEYGVVLSSYLGPGADGKVAEHIDGLLKNLTIEQINTLNSLIAPIVLKALQDPEYDVGLPREEKPKSKMGM